MAFKGMRFVYTNSSVIKNNINGAMYDIISKASFCNESYAICEPDLEKYDIDLFDLLSYYGLVIKVYGYNINSDTKLKYDEVKFYDSNSRKMIIINKAKANEIILRTIIENPNNFKRLENLFGINEDKLKKISKGLLDNLKCYITTSQTPFDITKIIKGELRNKLTIEISAVKSFISTYGIRPTMKEYAIYRTLNKKGINSEYSFVKNVIDEDFYKEEYNRVSMLLEEAEKFSLKEAKTLRRLVDESTIIKDTMTCIERFKNVELREPTKEELQTYINEFYGSDSWDLSELPDNYIKTGKSIL